MDDRKKQISDLEQRKREQSISLDALLTRLGETLLGRVNDSLQENNSAFGELDVFRRLKNDITDSEAAIQTVEEQIRRFRELEESIEAKEQENNAGSKELAIVYGRLGKLLLDLSADAQLNGAGSIAGDFVDFCVPYRDQADTLYTKVLSLEERLSGLEERDGGNVFTWIGKNAQGMVLRSFLTKAQDSLEQLYRNVGERYGRRDNNQLMDNTANSGGSSSEGVAVAELCAEIERRQADARVLLQELTDLKEERKEISGSFNAEGGPLKQIQTLKNNIAHVQDELKALYRRIGAEAAGIDGVERRDIINTLVKPEDQESLDNAVQISRLIRENERAIEKLQASLAIDDEKEKIEKYRKMIQEKKDKIAQAEKNITEYEEGIRVSETAIEKLQSLL
jgi:tetratricopeptide (TPR) repeat protein